MASTQDTISIRVQLVGNDEVRSKLQALGDSGAVPVALWRGLIADG